MPPNPPANPPAYASAFTCVRGAVMPRGSPVHSMMAPAEDVTPWRHSYNVPPQRDTSIRHADPSSTKLWRKKWRERAGRKKEKDGRKEIEAAKWRERGAARWRKSCKREEPGKEWKIIYKFHVWYKYDYRDTRIYIHNEDIFCCISCHFCFW